jgi:hypothetical protein
MASLQNITIPTPEPYDDKDPTRQQENYYYVYLQLLQAAKTAGEQVSFNPSTALSVDLSDLTAAVQSLAFNNEEFRLGALTIRFCGKVVTIEEV